MNRSIAILLLFAAALPLDAVGSDTVRILVTFEMSEQTYRSSSFQAPYRARKQYVVDPSIRSAAKAIARQHGLLELERWPLKSLSVFCYVFEVDKNKVDRVLAELIADSRIESAQRMNRFETQAKSAVPYDDEFLPMQHSLGATGVLEAHQISLGDDVRVAIVDSDADEEHEDLQGAISRSTHISQPESDRDRVHGTAVASVIGARANNTTGIVGVAPGASLEVSEACWRDPNLGKAICDTFSLAKALDAMVASPPAVINMSLAGPDDPLLRRVIDDLISRGAIVVAAWPGNGNREQSFPGSMPAVIAVASSGTAQDPNNPFVYAPGERILVAVPSNDYEFQSGSSLATAHITGIVALMKARFPQMSAADIRRRLVASQVEATNGEKVVNAYRALQ